MSVTGGSSSLRRAKRAIFGCMSGRRERRRWLRPFLGTWWRSGSGAMFAWWKSARLLLALASATRKRLGWQMRLRITRDSHECWRKSSQVDEVDRSLQTPSGLVSGSNHSHRRIEGKKTKAELRRIYSGLLLAWNVGLSHIIVEFDCVEAIKLIHQDDSLRGMIAIVCYIKELCKKDWRVSCLCIPRSGNRVADALAVKIYTLDLGLVSF
ncbi:hypothetical protein V6N13_046907 [Hibiscus sabdariffa]|uniref:RNase H type-1 domain-containing protein n=1 Tax=Hibiscus sabdariffa TaxID=183260 RepID=A0ABR2ATF0_9ROSI